MIALWELIPDSESLLALDPAELAGSILQVISARDSRNGYFSTHNFLGELYYRDPTPYPREVEREVKIAVLEAIAWLDATVLIAPEPTQDLHGGWRTLSRTGRAVIAEGMFANFRDASLLPKAILHPTLQSGAVLSFIRRDYDTAVFQAFKQVEVAIRTAGRYPETDYGIGLVRKAFHPDNGALRSSSEVPSEREALVALFVGAIGSYKNPHSHRTVTIGDPVDAVEMIMLASHLLRIIESMVKSQKDP